jgi:orotidine-5'-phosphate decarboxylase
MCEVYSFGVNAFLAKLQEAFKLNSSMLFVGLDPDPRVMPDMPVARFLCEIVECTQDLVCAYKPNLAFYEALGIDGWHALQEVLRTIPKSVVTIGDGKRGDTDNTSSAYAKAAFDVWGFDATTVAPYMGSDSIQPFIEHADKGVFVVCRTSNPGGDDFQTLNVGGRPLYERVALKARNGIRGITWVLLLEAHIQSKSAACASYARKCPCLYQASEHNVAI